MGGQGQIKVRERVEISQVRSCQVVGCIIDGVYQIFVLCTFSPAPCPSFSARLAIFRTCRYNRDNVRKEKMVSYPLQESRRPV